MAQLPPPSLPAGAPPTHECPLPEPSPLSAPWHLGPDQREHCVFAHSQKAHTPTQECLHTWGLAYVHRTGRGGLSAQVDPTGSCRTGYLAFSCFHLSAPFSSTRLFLSFPKTHTDLLLGRNPSKRMHLPMNVSPPGKSSFSLLLCPCESCPMSRSNFF